MNSLFLVSFASHVSQSEPRRCIYQESIPYHYLLLICTDVLQSSLGRFISSYTRLWQVFVWTHIFVSLSYITRYARAASYASVYL